MSTRILRPYISAILVVLALSGAFAQRPGGASNARSDFAAKRLVDKAEELLKLHEYDRGVKMLESVIDQYPNSPVRFKAYLKLGKHFIDVQQYTSAIESLRGLTKMKKKDEELVGEEREWYLEAQYLTGVAYFNMRDYGKAFTVLRKITKDAPNSVWANQSYYYIGMCHFALKNWHKAIEALSMVGTFVDPDSPTVELAEAGKRFYVKIEDEDIPVLVRTGKDIQVELTAKSGDTEKTGCVQISEGAPIAVGSIPTSPGTPKPGDGTLQIVGGDEITVKYYDANTAEGKGNVLKEQKVKMVSSGMAEFTLGTYEDTASAVYLGQPLYVVVKDLDMDTDATANTVTIRVVSRFKKQLDEIEGMQSVDLESIYGAEEDQYEIRDEIKVTLTEAGKPPVHSGKFTGSINVQPTVEGSPVDKFDSILSCSLNDEVVAIYEDELHIKGESTRDVEAKLEVTGEIDTRPKASQNVVADPIVKARKELIEAKAYLELTQIFKSMGLVKNAMEKYNAGMERVQSVIVEKARIPADLKEEAFQIKWSLEIAMDKYREAVNTCQMFSRLYPNSSFADDALMKIGDARLEEKNYRGATEIYRNVLSLPNSHAKAEAQFKIAEASMAQIEERAKKSTTPVPKQEILRSQGSAMQLYKTCAERYPESPYAGQSLGKLIDYYYETKDYAQAENLLEQVFQDYPDAKFLDSMLLKWVIVAFRMGNYEKAEEKCSKLLFDHPGSEFAQHAQKMLPAIQKRLNRSK